jgi:hypothetical protein
MRRIADRPLTQLAQITIWIMEEWKVRRTWQTTLRFQIQRQENVCR